MKNELKPCPFCGSENVHLSCWSDQAYVYCADCMVKTDVYLHGNCAERAAEVWNRRTEEFDVDGCQSRAGRAPEDPEEPEEIDEEK